MLEVAAVATLFVIGFVTMQHIILTRLKDIAAAIWLGVIPVFLFQRSIPYKMLNWDDRMYITENAWLLNFSLKNIIGIFSHSYFSNYHPLTMLNYMVDFQFFGYQPAGYRAENILLHALAVVSGFVLLRVARARTIPAFLATLFFAIHPLRLESVVWISERKDVLCALFYFTSLACWIASYRWKRWGNWLVAASVMMAILAMLAKAMAISLPIVFILYDVFLGAGINRKRMAIYATLIVGAVAVAIANRAAQHTAVITALSLPERLKVALWSPVHYLGSTIWPSGLCALYPYEERPTLHLIPTLVGAACTAVLAACAFAMRRRTPGVTFAILAAAACLAPVSGIVAFGSAYAADRYSYIPTMLVLLGLLPWVSEKSISFSKVTKIIFSTVTLTACIVLSAITWNLMPHWENSESLWARVMEIHPNTSTGRTNIAHARIFQPSDSGSSSAHKNLTFELNDPTKEAEFKAAQLVKAGLFQEAGLNAKLIPNPTRSLYWQLRAARQGNDPDNMRTLATLLLSDPNADPEQRAEAALSLTMVGALDQAKAALDGIGVPTVTGGFAWGLIAEKETNSADGIEAAEKSLAIFPAQENAVRMLTKTFLETGRTDEARKILHRAARHPGANATTRAFANARLGMIAERVDHDSSSAGRYFDRAFSPILDETDSVETQAQILTYVGVLAEEAHRANDAESLYLQALRVNPSSPEALQNLAILRIGQSRRNEALVLLEKAHEISPGDAEISANLQRLKEEIEKLNR